MEIYLPDACALISYLDGETGGENIQRIFYDVEPGNALAYMHAVNIYEVYYPFLRLNGSASARQLWLDIAQLPIKILYTLHEAFIKVAATYKANFKMSVTDSFLLTQAQLLNAKVVTADHHKLDAVDKAGLIQFAWYR